MLGHSPIAATALAEVPAADGGVGTSIGLGDPFVKQPSRRLSLRDLQEYFSSEQEALERAEKAKRKREREALENAAQAAARAMRAAVGLDDGIEPDIADVALKLQAAAQARRATHAIRLAEEAARMAAELERTIRFRKGYLEQDPEEEEEDFLHLVFLYP